MSAEVESGKDLAGNAADDVLPLENSGSPYNVWEDKNLRITLMKRRLNATNFRIRFLPHDENERTEVVVLGLLRSRLNLPLNLSDFVFCKRVDTFDGSLPQDVLVEFKDVNLRDQVFAMGCIFWDLGLQFWDNLCSERLSVWKSAVLKFGHYKVSIHEGAIRIQAPDSTFYIILTLYQYKKFLEKYNL